VHVIYDYLTSSWGERQGPSLAQDTQAGYGVKGSYEMDESSGKGGSMRVK